MLLLRKINLQDKEQSNEFEELTIKLRTIIDPEELSKIQQEIIKKLLYLPKRIARRYITIYNKQYLEEDIIGAGMVGLVQSVMTANVKLKDNNILGLITMKIHDRIINFIRKESKLYSKKMLSRSYKSAHVINHDAKIFEIKEMLSNVVKTDVERKIIELKLMNYSDVEIGDIIGMSRLNVNIIRNKILRRLRANEDERKSRC